MRGWVGIGLALSAGWLALAALAVGAEPDPPAVKPSGQDHRPRGPVEIRSDALRVHQKQRTAVFTGHVETVQDDLTIRCARLDVRYAAADAAGDIRSMVFTGDVRIVDGERRGHCERAEYDRPRGRVVCTGEPWVIEGGNRIHGEKIVFWLERDQVEVVHPRAVLQMPARPDGGSSGDRP